MKFEKSDRIIKSSIMLKSLIFGIFFVTLISCSNISDSIQNYEGAEIVVIKERIDAENNKYYIVHIRQIDSLKYRIIKIYCRDAWNYQVGDTIKHKPIK